MDTSIRSLLVAAQKTIGQEKNPALLQAYSLLRTVAETKPAVDTPESFSPDLYVLCAEIAFQNGLLDISKECLKMYFMKPPPANQFLCRAYLCQAQLLAPKTATTPEQLEKAVVYLLKAISFAKENPRYHFLVYNASVIYWQFCRPYLKTNFRQFLARSLHQVVKALDDIDDKDFEWRAQLMIALIECNLDAGRKTDASHIASAAATFIKQNVPALYKQVFGIIVRNQLIDSSKLHKDVKGSAELAIFYQICKLRVSLDNNEPREYYAEIQRILNQMGVPHTAVVVPTAKTKKAFRTQSPASGADGQDRLSASNGSQTGRRPSIGMNGPLSTDSRSQSGGQTGRRPSLVGSSSGFFLLSRDITNVSEVSLPVSRDRTKENLVARSPDVRSRSRSPLKRDLTNGNGIASSGYLKFPSPELSSRTPIEAWVTKSPGGLLMPPASSPEGKGRRSPSKAGRRTPTPVSGKKLTSESSEKPLLLLELARLCLELDFPDLAQDCADHMKTCTVKDQGFYLELEFLQCEIMVKNLSERQESLQKNVVDVRLQAMKRCEEAIMNAIRLGSPNVIQVGCVTQWNLCLPLLQPNLRRYARKPLTQVAEALESIQSLLVQLRCQVHTELAKCEEDQEQIGVALENLRKALALDDGDVYRERLEVSLQQLELRSELYKQPERPEDIACMIIEQARKADSGTMRMKRSLLVKAGEALAPDAFLLVLDSESDTKDVTGGKAPLTVIKKLSNKARQFNKCVKKAEGHLQRLGDENDRERARLWGDLAKTARKQEVWDVCRVAARFCLLYDDARWKNTPPAKFDRRPSAKPSGRGTESSFGERSGSPMERQGTQSRPQSPSRIALYDIDLIRMLAEVNFIFGEANVHLLRSEGVELNDMPIPPVDKSKHPKGYIAKKPEEDPDWIEYCDWIKSLSGLATSSFLRGLALGVEIEEAWLVCCGTAYIWNYNNHVLTQLRHREIMATLTTVFLGLKKVGHAGETMALVNICNALAYALMKPWIPVPSKDPTPPPSPAGDQAASSAKKTKTQPTGGKSKPTATVAIASEAMPDLKKAIEVSEYVMDVTNGNNPQDVVPIHIRMPILQTWVSVKQMAQQQINKNFAVDEEPYTEGQRQMTRAIVAVEMLSRSKNGIMEFKEVPPIAEVASMVEECKWSDKFVELQLWTRLTALAYEQKAHNLVLKCSKKALRFATVGTQPKNRKMEPHRYMVEQEMLSYSSGIQGQSLIENMAGKNAIRREALAAFLDSTRFARNADNYEMVMTAARHYWNACCPLVSQPIERELLREPVRMILQCISSTAEKIKKKEEKTEEDEEPKGEGQTGSEVTDDKDKSVGGIGAVEDDLTLRAALYGVLFQSYTDKREWEEGLKAMDQAITDMPRTKHRLLIFKHRVMTKAKLGRSVAMDIQKFKDESEDYVAHMWRRVALSSKETAEQLLSYQNAIEALSSPSNEWLKVELLVEFGQWLYVKDFPLQDALDQLEWAIDIMLNMQADTDARKEQELLAAAVAAEAKKAAGKGTSCGSSPVPPPPTCSSPRNQSAKQSPKRAAKKGDKKGTATAPKPPRAPSAKKSAKSDTEPAKKEQAPSEKATQSVSGTEADLAEGIVPVAKQAVIGVLPANPSLKIQDITDVRVLDGLIRAHVLVADMVGRGSEAYLDYLLMAYGYVLKLWQATVPLSGPTVKEIAKNPPAAADTASNAKGSAKGKKGEKGPKDPPVKEKTKRKGPLDILPHTLEDWAVYDVPDEVLEAFKHEMMKETGINNHTFQKPMLTLHYLESLVKQLRNVGYNHLTLPVLAMEDLLSRELLPSDALKALIHLQAMEVCLELNLKTGYSYHEKVAGPTVISEEDQARSRDEIALWKEKQAQVIKEELRVKETLAKIAQEVKAKDRKAPPTRSQAASSPESEKPVETHLGKVLGAVTFRDVWTEMAEVLLRQGHYQSAREFLNEAYTAALAFEDVPLQARILYLLGHLSFQEAQFGQAVNFCKKAQSLYFGDEKFWYDTTMLMVNATQQDYENRKAKRVCRGILVHSLNEFMRMLDERPNRSSIIGFVVAMLEARLAATQWSIIMQEHQDINIPKVMSRVHEICERFDQATQQMVRLGYKREALPLMKEHAAILHKMAQDSLEKEIKHTYYIQAMMVLKEGVSVAEEIAHDTQCLFSLQEIRNMSLPVQREVADMKIACGEIMLEIFRAHAREMRFTQLEDQRKGSVLKMVEDFIRATPDYTHMEREWVESTQTVVEDAILKFLDAHNMAASIPHIKARAVCGVGQCLRALAMHRSPDPPTQWVVHELELAKLSQDGEEDEDEEEMDPHSRQFMKYAKQIREMKVSGGVCRHYLVQATECLIQALNLSLQKKYRDIAATASLELVECFGQFDASASSLFLALFQSCHASLRMEELLCGAQLDPQQSKLAALLRQRTNLLAQDVTANSGSSAVMATVQTALENDWQAWKRMEVLPSHLDMLKEFPSNFNFLILQHSPDKTFLYGAILDKPKAAGGGGGGEKKNPKQASAPASSRARVFGMETSPRELEGLLSKCSVHRQNVQQLLLKQEYQRSQAAMRQKMLENLDDVTKGHKGRSQVDENEREERHLQDEFRDLCFGMEQYLKPVLAQMDLAPLPSSPCTSTTDKHAKEPKEPPPPPQDYAIILADPDLMELPLEALRAFQPSNIVSLSRDFSLQLFYHRYHQDIPQEDAAAAAKKQKSKSIDQPFSRIPGLRDASKKMAKIIPLNRPLNPWNQPVDTMNFRFIVDPHLDCPETEENKPIEVFNKLLELYEQQFTPRWLGVLGEEHSPSVGEWEIYLTENSSFIFYGMEKLLSYIPPAKLSALNIPDCMIVYLLDMAQTTKSFTRQSKVDVLKSSNTLTLEKPVETALLISLSGVKCVIKNQWHCTLAENASKLDTSMKDLLEGGMSTGEALRMLFAPYHRKLPSSGEGGEEGEGEHSETKSQDGGAQDDSRSQQSGSVMTDRSQTSDRTRTTATDHRENIDIQRSWYNLVCYGLPNLIITQV